MKDRIEYAKEVLFQMEIDKANGVLSNEDELEIKGRLLNIVLRGYDIPLQGSTHNTYEIKRVFPESHSFKRDCGFQKI